MHSKITELAKQAGFVFWSDEEHGPGPGHIDWSSEYDFEFEKFATLLIEECARVSANGVYGTFDASKNIKMHFDMQSRADTCVLLSPKKEFK